MYVVVVWAVTGDEKPATLSPITELLKVPAIFRVLLETEEQFPTKLIKLLQVRLPTVKYSSIDNNR